MENDFKYGNFTREDVTQFPIDCETMDTLQNNTRLMSVIARIAGAEHEGTHLLILSGCKKNGARRTAGYVYISGPETADGGEILYHPEQPDAATCFIEETHDDVAANGQTFSQAYTTRRLTSGNGPNAHAWKNFTDIATISNAELSERIEQRYEAVNKKVEEVKQSPTYQFVTGMIIMWSGSSADVPEGWALCNGSNGTPNLTGRFILGGKSKSYGGSTTNNGLLTSNSITLTESNMPKHNHSVSLEKGGAHSHKFRDYYYPEKYSSASHKDDWSHNGKKGSGSSDDDNSSILYYEHYTSSTDDHTHKVNESDIGSGTSFNIQTQVPYYALCFIMKL